MREIKFRAWDKETERMWTDVLSELGEVDQYDDELSMWAVGQMMEEGDNSKFEFMQFTGLKDKNGREIYEGDHLRCKKYIGGNFVEYCYESGYVDFVHGAFGLHRKQGYYRPFKDWLEDYELEVIGNIHENQELLKGGTSDALHK